MVALVSVPLMLTAELFARAGLMITSCIETPSAVGWLGTRLALVHADPSCMPGSVAVGGAPSQVLTVLACVALPVLLAHTGLGLAALGMIRRSVRALRRVRAGIVRRWPRIPRLATAAVPHPVSAPVLAVVLPPVERFALGVPSLRAPPYVAAA
jgi:hypothetical protein